MKRLLLSKVFKKMDSYVSKEVYLCGWIKSNRDQKNFGFIMLNDGTTFNSIQVVYLENIRDFDKISKYRVGSSISVLGTVVKSPNGNSYELQAKEITLLGDCDLDYPIQPKQHTREFLRENAHFRSRTNLFNAVFRVRSKSAYYIHKFFQENDFLYVNTPILTAIDGEGAGQMFTVTTFDLEELKKKKEVDYKEDFFHQKASLAVTGQLEAEALAMSFSNVYTFGPTFRAENSNTQKHAAEFWMIEPEMAFANLNDNMLIMEKMIKYVIKNILNTCKDEMKFFDSFVEKGLINRLNSLVKSKFYKVKHKDAITILLNSKKKFENEPKYGEDLSTEHEKYLTEEYFKGPVFVTDWPKNIKAFYMKLNNDNETVAAVDLLVPGPGELCGGSQREENIEKLKERMRHYNISEDVMKWYLDTRRYGGCIHSGFGMGFERFLMYITGVENIRDVIPFPRTPRNIEF